MAYIDQHVGGCGLGHLLWHWCNCFFLFNFSLLILGALVQVDVEPNWRMNLTNTIWPRLFRVFFCRTAEALRGRVEEITQHLANTPRYGAWEWVFGSDFGLSWARTSMVFPIICNVFGRSGFQASTGIVFQEVLQRPTKNCLVGNSWKGLTPLTINEAAYQILSVSHMETHVPVGLETALIQKLLLCRTFLHNFSFPSSISRWCKLMFYIYIYTHVSTGCVQVLQPPSLYLPKTGGWRPADHDAFLRLLLGRFRGRPTGEFLAEACLTLLQHSGGNPPIWTIKKTLVVEVV